MALASSPDAHPRAGLEGYHPQARGDVRLVTSHRPGSNVSVSAVGMLAGHEIRRRWRSTIAIVLLVGVVGAIVLATAAGARRSDTALSRFNSVSRSSALEISVGTPTPAQLAKFRRTPGVVAFARLRGYSFAEESAPLPGLAIAAPLGPAMGKVVDRSRLIAGRRADPSAANEVVIGESLAERLHWRVGHHINTKTYTQPQIAVAFAGGNPGAAAGPDVSFRIVGIERRPLDLGVRSISGGVIVLTPAFHQKYQGQIGWYTDVLRVRTTGAPGVDARVGAAARRIWGKEPVFGSQSLGIETEGARSAIDVLTLALWIVAGVTALAGFVAIGIVLSRDVASANVEQATLRSLGLTRRQRIAANGPRALLVAGAGTVLAGIGAVVLSPLFPIGVARRADPDLGFHADWVVLLLGLAGVGIVVLGIAYLAAVRATRTESERSPRPYRATTAVVERAAAAGLRPAATNGLRMAIQSGRGASAVPVRSAFGGAVFGVAGITIALVFAASLSHLVETPRLYGWTWDVKAEVPTANPCVDANDFGIGRASGVAAVGLVCTTSGDFELEGRPVTGWGFRSLRGSIEPEIVDGRAPRGPREMAIGSVTMHAIGKHVGDTVNARGPNGVVKYVVVGQVVLPTVGEAQPLADGAAVTEAGFRQLQEPGGNETDFLVARAVSGRRAEVEQYMRSIRRARNIGTPAIPVEVERLQQIDRVPASIAALLAALALIAVGHALVTAVRRRRSELALLKVLGFGRRQVRATVAWQATILGAVGLALGIPIGIILGRLLWQAVANGLGVSPEVATPAVWLLLSVPCVLVLVNLIAFFPARSAARTRPAVALRAA